MYDRLYILNVRQISFDIDRNTGKLYYEVDRCSGEENASNRLVGYFDSMDKAKEARKTLESEFSTDLYDKYYVQNSPGETIRIVRYLCKNVKGKPMNCGEEIVMRIVAVPMNQILL